MKGGAIVTLILFIDDLVWSFASEPLILFETRLRVLLLITGFVIVKSCKS